MNPRAASPAVLSWACQAGRSPAFSATLHGHHQPHFPDDDTNGKDREAPARNGRARIQTRAFYPTSELFPLFCGVPRMFQRWRGKQGPESNEGEPQRKIMERWSLTMWSCLQLLS